MKANGSKIFNMDMDKRLGKTDQLSTPVSFTRERSMERENLNGKMEVTMREISYKGSLRASESIILLISIRSTKESSETVQWKEKAEKSGLMARSMMETSRMGRKMVKALSNGRTAISILDHGNKESSMGLAYGLALKRLGLRSKESGSMGKDTDGLMALSFFQVNHLTLRRQEYEIFIYS